MKKSSRRWALSLPLWVALLLVPACGGTSTERAARDASDASESTDLAWTRSLLRKLDAPLRARVRADDGSRLAIKVFFRARVADRELATLMLTQVGSHYVGNVRADVVQRIAARDDVDRIETLRDVGY